MNKFINSQKQLNVISDMVRKHRKSNNWSLADLSNQLMLLGIDIPKPSIQNIENGKRVVKEYEFYAICKVFNISMEDMLKNYINEL